MKRRKTWLSTILVCCGKADKEYAEDRWRQIKDNCLSGLWNVCGCFKRQKEPLTRESLYTHNRCITSSFG